MERVCLVIDERNGDSAGFSPLGDGGGLGEAVRLRADVRCVVGRRDELLGKCLTRRREGAKKRAKRKPGPDV